MLKKLLLLILICPLVSCEIKDIPSGNGNTNIPETNDLLILCEGLAHMNNSTMSIYDAKKDTLISKYFQATNSRGLGDTANDMEKYGAKTYILVNVSSQVEIIDHTTGISLKQIPLFNENKIARQPRHIAFHENKAYVTCFDGHVVRIDTTTLEIDGTVKCGKNPEGICVANKKLYVANSGGLDFPAYDTTVSVIDIATYKHIKYITVGINPVSIASDSEGDVYVITNGNYGNEDYCFYRIDSQTDKIAQTFPDINPLSLTIYKDKAYMYSFDFTSNTQWIKVFDCISESIIMDNFITDNTKIQTPFGININPYNGDVIITEAYNFVVWGDILCFDKHGKLKYRLNEVGLNPNSVIFI